MRAPSFGAPVEELYQAALEICAWAEGNGCLAAVVCEHHASPDGYLPTPLILLSAIAARTSRLAINAVVILPLYDPVRLAEEMAVVDIISRGRTSFTLGLGYRSEEYEHFGKNVHDRGRIADDSVALVRQLLAGQVVDFGGRRIRVTPGTFTPGGSLLMWGGGSVAAARRAGRYGLSLLAQANVPGMQEEYERSCHQHGHEPGVTLLPPRDTHSVCSSQTMSSGRGRSWDPSFSTMRKATLSGIRTTPRRRASHRPIRSMNSGKLRGRIAFSQFPRQPLLWLPVRCSTSRRSAGDFLQTKHGPTSNALPNRSSQRRPLSRRRLTCRA
jgi:hypothetical protein